MIVVAVTLFSEGSPPDDDDCGKSMLELNINAGLWGEGRLVSLPSMKTTSNMDGGFRALSSTHKSPIWIRLRTISIGNY